MLKDGASNITRVLLTINLNWAQIGGTALRYWTKSNQLIQKGNHSRGVGAEIYVFQTKLWFFCFHSRCWHIMATLSTFSFLFVFAESKGDLGWCTSVVYRAIWKQIKTWSEFAKAILCYANIWGDEITLKKKEFKALPEMPFLFMHRRKLFILKKNIIITIGF